MSLSSNSNRSSFSPASLSSLISVVVDHIRRPGQAGTQLWIMQHRQSRCTRRLTGGVAASGIEPNAISRDPHRGVASSFSVPLSFSSPDIFPKGVKPCELLCHQSKIHASSNPCSRLPGRGGAMLSVDTDELVTARLFEISTPRRARRGWRWMKGKARTRGEKVGMELACKNPCAGSSVRSIFENGLYKGAATSLLASEHMTQPSSREATTRLLPG
jgi:hypothetical protein